MQRNAWLLTLENHHTIAIAQQQVVEYLHLKDAITVPASHPRCQQVILWRDRIVPLLGTDSHPTLRHEHVLVILYRHGDQAQYLALSLQQPPVDVVVRDADQCSADLAQQTYWHDALLCCVQTNNGKAGLVDFSKLH